MHASPVAANLATPADPLAACDHALPLAVLLQRSPARWQLLLAWLLSLALCLWLGVVELYAGWYGYSVHFGELDFVISIYPPLTIATLWVLWFGYAWGASLAYLSTLLVAYLSGLSLGWALLFACSNPLGLLVMSLVYRHVKVRYVPSSLPAALFFVTICFISAVSSATGSFIWSYSNKLSAMGAFAVWQGWWSGNFLQTVLTCGPLLLLGTPAVLRWREQRWPQRAAVAPAQRWVGLVAVFALCGVLGFLWLSFWLADRSVAAQVGDSAQAWQQRAMLYRDSAMAVYWVLSVLMLALVFLGYRFFRQRTLQLQQAAQSVAFERDWALQRQQEAESAHQALQTLNRELAVHMAEVEQLQQQLQEQARRDPLTGLYNRRYLHERLPVELQHASHLGQSLCLVLIDLDHFKAVNDQYGHAMGDAVLKALATLFAGRLRAADFAVRYGGEEFCLVLPGCDIAGAAACVAELQQAYAGCRVAGDSNALQGLHFSAGIASYPTHGSDEEALLREADAALYQAKAAGRNCVRHRG